MFENHFGKRIPKIVNVGKFVEKNQATTERLFLHPDLDQTIDSSYVAVAPSDLLTLANVVATDVLKILQNRAGLFEGLTTNSLKRRFARFDPTGGNTPTASANICDENLVAIPGKDQSYKGAQGRMKRRRVKLEPLPTVLPGRKPFHLRTTTFPMMLLISTNPNFRLSSEKGRLSPRT